MLMTAVHSNDSEKEETSDSRERGGRIMGASSHVFFEIALPVRQCIDASCTESSRFLDRFLDVLKRQHHTGIISVAE